jgi:hypothetical protein
VNYQFFKRLPSSLYYELRDFLSSKCYYELLMTTKLMNEIRYETRIVVLKDLDELDTVLHKISNPKTQLVIDKISEAGELPSYKIKFRNCPDRNKMEIAILYLDFSNQLLRSCRCNSFFALNLSRLSYFSKLTLNSFRITNERYLSNLSFLELINCSDFSDLAGLGKIPNLFLNSCQAIKNISPLTSNTKLTILHSYNVDLETLNFQTVRYFATDLIHDYE